MKRREFLAAGFALNFGAAATVLAQQGGVTQDGRGRGASRPAGGGSERREIPTRRAKTTKLFKSPEMYPNALAVMTDAPGGLWIGRQRVTRQNARRCHRPLESGRRWQ